MFLLVLAVTGLYGLVCDATKVPLDPHNTGNLDIYVRRQMLIKINAQLEKQVPEYTKLRDSCGKLLNASIEKCTECSEEQKKKMDSTGYKLLTILFLPDMLLTDFLKKQEGKMKEVVGFMGSHAKQYLNSMSDLAGTVTSSMKKGISDLGAMTLGGLEALTNKLDGSVKDIVTGAIKGVRDLTKGLGDLAGRTGRTLDNIGKGLKGISGRVIDFSKNTINGAKDLLKGIGSNIGNVINTITNPIRRISIPSIRFGFGKKKRSLRGRYGAAQRSEELFRRTLEDLMVGAAVDADLYSRGYRTPQKRILYEHILKLGSCPICEKLDTEKRSVEEIMDELCGDTRTKEKKLIAAIKKAQVMFDYLQNNGVITSVEYDPTSFTVGAQGLTYTKVFVRAVLNGEEKYFQSAAELNYANIDAMGDVILKELKDKFFPKP